ncbi:MAG: DUF1223 domain-containing protein, partial [Holophagales bacterium]|nr:DUF1223 domain-containing protein [Holophagales bacterium]
LGESQGVVPLSFHVDYWNYIGWRDPFSSPQFSERQRRYARQLAGGRVYTPQLVVDGRGECVGSDRGETEALIAAAREQPRHGRVRLSVRVSAGAKLHVRAVGSLAAGAPDSLGRLELWLAVFETGLETPVDRGENARRTLHNDFVVRRLESLGKASAAAPADAGLEVALETAWNAENLGVVAFLRDPSTLAVHGAAVWRSPG